MCVIRYANLSILLFFFFFYRVVEKRGFCFYNLWKHKSNIVCFEHFLFLFGHIEKIYDRKRMQKILEINFYLLKRLFLFFLSSFFIK